MGQAPLFTWRILGILVLGISLCIAGCESQRSGCRIKTKHGCFGCGFAYSQFLRNRHFAKLRERSRVLAKSCHKGDGAACHKAAQVYQQSMGNREHPATVKEISTLHRKGCQLGFKPSCAWLQLWKPYIAMHKHKYACHQLGQPNHCVALGDIYLRGYNHTPRIRAADFQAAKKAYQQGCHQSPKPGAARACLRLRIKVPIAIYTRPMRAMKIVETKPGAAPALTFGEVQEYPVSINPRIWRLSLRAYKTSIPQPKTYLQRRRWLFSYLKRYHQAAKRGQQKLALYSLHGAARVIYHSRQPRQHAVQLAFLLAKTYYQSGNLVQAARFARFSERKARKLQRNDVSRKYWRSAHWKSRQQEAKQWGQAQLELQQLPD